MDVMSDEMYTDYLRGKRVILVSHAASLVGSRRGEFIDSYDIVARLNDSIPSPKELDPDIGTKCDILYSSMSPYFGVSCGKAQSVVDSGVKVIVRPTPLTFRPIKGIIGGCKVTAWKDKLVNAILDTELSIRVVEEEPYLSHTRTMRGNIPLTGVAAVWDLLEFDVAEVFMIGFNFFLEETYGQYPQQPRTPEEVEKWDWGTKWVKGNRHSILPQIQYLYKMAEKDARIKMDATLARILATHGPIAGVH